MLEVKTMKGSGVMAKIAGIESSANTKSLASTTTSESSNGVAKRRPDSTTVKLPPRYSLTTGTRRENKPQQWVLLRTKAPLPSEEEANAGEQKEGSKHVEHPVKALQQCRTRRDE